ncbi:methyl-accepting chemotaxis protein [Salmonella enterica subsp. enterica]|uniref:Methyl-accepting chemotaxis protein n=1 Tax=Salmonella enterica I TaxID=59201 RepID=A0A379V0T0_SALET|nr:methyl-accepting chemotaxis protein [Salmonella enterica subsp. enterica]
MAYMQQNDRLYDIAVEDNNSSYNQAMWVLVSVLIAVLVVIIAVWFGIKLSLIAPMNRLIESIRHIASGRSGEAYRRGRLQRNGAVG